MSAVMEKESPFSHLKNKICFTCKDISGLIPGHPDEMTIIRSDIEHICWEYRVGHNRVIGPPF